MREKEEVMAETVLTYTPGGDGAYWIVSGYTSIADDGSVVIPNSHENKPVREIMY